MLNPRLIPWQMPDRNNFVWLTWFGASFGDLRLFPVDRDRRVRRDSIDRHKIVMETFDEARALVFLESSRTVNVPELCRSVTGIPIGKPKNGTERYLSRSDEISRTVVPVLMNYAPGIPKGKTAFHDMWNILKMFLNGGTLTITFDRPHRFVISELIEGADREECMREMARFVMERVAELDT